MRLGGKLLLQIRQLRAARAAPVRAAGLRHETRNHAVEQDPVIEAAVGQLHQAGHMIGGQVRAQPDGHVAGFQRQLQLVGHG